MTKPQTQSSYSASRARKKGGTFAPAGPPVSPSPRGSSPSSTPQAIKSPPKHRKKRARLSPEARANICKGALDAIAAGRWPSPAGPPWTPAEDAQLGTAPDSVIAARLGRSRGSVAGRRHKLGIASPAKAGRPIGCHSTWNRALKTPRKTNKPEHVRSIPAAPHP